MQMTRRPRRIAVALTVPTLLIIGCSGNERSHAPARADGQDELFVQTLKQQYGITVDSDTAADIANVACESPSQGVGLYNAQQELAQRHPEINRSNPNAVGLAMGAAVLAYCPERLQ